MVKVSKMAREKNSKEAIKGDRLLQWDKIKISNSEKKSGERKLKEKWNGTLKLL